MSINKIIIIILIFLSLGYPREKDTVVIEITHQIEELLINKEWNKVPCIVGNFILYNSDKKLPILYSIGRMNGEPVSTLSAVLEFLKITEECDKTDTICGENWPLSVQDTALFVEMEMQILYHKKLLYGTWIGTGKTFKKTEFSKRIYEKINLILLTRRTKYQNLITLKKNSIKNISNFKEKKKQPEKKKKQSKLKEAIIYALSQNEYKKLKLEQDINETIRDKKTYESRIIKELRYSKQYQLPLDKKELTKLKQSMINLEIIIEEKLLKYKLKIDSDFDTSINVDYEKELKDLKRKLVKEYLIKTSSSKKSETKSKEISETKSKEIEENTEEEDIDIGWE